MAISGPLDRALPHSLDAERAVLGAVLMHNDALTHAADVLTPTDFFRDAHRRIFARMLDLSERGHPIDFLSLKEALTRAGELEEVGGPAYLASLVDGLPHATNTGYYARIVKEKSQIRQVIGVASKATARAYEEESSPSDLATEAADQLYDLGGAAMPGKPMLLRELAHEGIAAIERMHATKGLVTGLATGFEKLDLMTSGLQPSDLVLIAARTSVGKTSLAMNIARHVAEHQTVLVFSLEMSRHQLFMRLFAAEAQVDSHKLRMGYLTESDWKRVSTALVSLSNLTLLIDDGAGIGVREVRARARRVRAEHGLGLIVIDYLQLMRGQGKFDGRTQEIGSISRGLKAIAKEFEIPVIALAQLSRKAAEDDASRKPRKPQLSDIRESGDLENDADLVLLIYRPKATEDKPDPPAEIILAKQRNGPIGSVELGFVKEQLRFHEIEATT